MGSVLRACAFLLGCSLVFGCATKHDEESVAEQARAERFRNSFETASAQDQAGASQALVSKAHSAIGTPYVPGGSTLRGFDCSGLVSWAYKSVGVKLPRTAREQSVVGEKIKDPDKMRAGDIVAFHHPRRGYHTGIYVGDGKFIHSPRRRTKVRINSLSDPYFNGTFLGARRVRLEEGTDLVAQAEKRLVAYADENTVRQMSNKNKTRLSAAKRTVKKHKLSRSLSKKTAIREVASKKAKNSEKQLVAGNVSKSGRKLLAAKKTAGIKGKIVNTQRNGKLVAGGGQKSAHKSVSISTVKNRKIAGEKTRKRS